LPLAIKPSVRVGMVLEYKTLAFPLNSAILERQFLNYQQILFSGLLKEVMKSKNFDFSRGTVPSSASGAIECTNDVKYATVFKYHSYVILTTIVFQIFIFK
jgi:hypothetical protein